MCKYTISFYECYHRVEDNVDTSGCWRYQEHGTHCDPDNPELRGKSCTVTTEDRNGICPRCLRLEQARMEEEALQRDMEKAWLFDIEEQRRNKEAHEAHLARVQKQSLEEWRRTKKSEMEQAVQESAEQAQRQRAAVEALALTSVMESSGKEFFESQKANFGDVVENGSLQMEAILRKSAMDWHHPKWGPGANEIQTMADTDEVVGEEQMRMETKFSMAQSHQKFERTRQHGQISPHTEASFRKESTSAQAYAFISTCTTAVPPPPPPLPGASISKTSARSPVTKTTILEEITAKFSTLAPTSPVSTHAQATVEALKLKTSIHAHVHTERPAAAPSTSPASLTLAFPPIDYSQPPKDQNYGRFKIGFRSQPIHPSQELPDNPATATSPTTPRARAPAVRLAGTLNPLATPPPTSFQMHSGDHLSRLLSVVGPKRTAPKHIPRKQEGPNELEAIWSRRGIQREVEVEVEDVCSVTPSQSASQVPTRVPSEVGRGEDDEEEGGDDSGMDTGLLAQRLAAMDKRRRGGFGAN